MNYEFRTESDPHEALVTTKTKDACINQAHDWFYNRAAENQEREYEVIGDVCLVDDEGEVLKTEAYYDAGVIEDEDVISDYQQHRIY